jgi:ATP-binding cassette subfamily B (MDR/TAP) protein 8
MQQGIVNTLSELRRASGALFRIRHMMSTSDVDPNMYSALAPGAWWEVANGGPVSASQPYADEAGLAAVEAARRGALEVRRKYQDMPRACMVIKV